MGACCCVTETLACPYLSLKHYLMKKENKPTKIFMKFNKIYSQTLKFQYIMTVQLLIGLLSPFVEKLHFLEKWYLSELACEHDQANIQALVCVGLIILKLIYSKPTLARNHVMNQMSSSDSSILKGLLCIQQKSLLLFFPPPSKGVHLYWMFS